MISALWTRVYSVIHLKTALRTKYSTLNTTETYHNIIYDRICQTNSSLSINVTQHSLSWCRHTLCARHAFWTAPWTTVLKHTRQNFHFFYEENWWKLNESLSHVLSRTAHDFLPFDCLFIEISPVPWTPLTVFLRTRPDCAACVPDHEL
jgi:hypothetical protein